MGTSTKPICKWIQAETLFVDYQPPTILERMFFPFQFFLGPFRKGGENLLVEIQFLVPFMIGILFVLSDALTELLLSVTGVFFQWKKWIAASLVVLSALFL
jgi:hypothetical protein